MQALHIFSFFSGSGFLDLGFEKSGYVVDSVNEFSPAFTKAYRYARMNMGIPEPRFGYTRDINDFLTKGGGKQLRKIIKTVQNEGGLVGFIGGPPCPDFSVAGKQKGRDGDNGKLSQSYIDLIFRQKPDFFLFENVKGLWRTAKHREYFEELKSKLAKYYLLTNRLCNALEYGAPQDRDRILLFGIRKGVAKRLGLTRMKGLYDMIPGFKTRYVIVAPDEDRDSVIEKCNRPQFECLDARYFSYSSVEELYHICTHRNLRGVTQEFLDCYMERVCQKS